MRVHHLNCGTMRPLGGRLVDGRPGLFPARHHGLPLPAPGEPPPGWSWSRRARARRPRSTARAWPRRRVRPAVEPARGTPRSPRSRRSGTLGFDPADVRDIVLTHLDLDHAGGLIDFPWARVHVYAEELRALQSPSDAAERGAVPEDPVQSWSTVDVLCGHRRTVVRLRRRAAAGRPAGGDPAGPARRAHARARRGRRRHRQRVAAQRGRLVLFHGQVDPAAPHCPPGLKWFEGPHGDGEGRPAGQSRPPATACSGARRRGESLRRARRDPVPPAEHQEQRMKVHHFNCGTMRPAGGKLLDGEPGLLRRGGARRPLPADRDRRRPRAGRHRVRHPGRRPARQVAGPAVHGDGRRPALEGRDGRRADRGARPRPVPTSATSCRPTSTSTTAGGLADFPNAVVHVRTEEQRAATAPSNACREEPLP